MIASSYPILGEIIFLKHWVQISIAKNNTKQITGHVNHSLRITTCTKIKKSTENESPRIEKVCTGTSRREGPVHTFSILGDFTTHSVNNRKEIQGKSLSKWHLEAKNHQNFSIKMPYSSHRPLHRLTKSYFSQNLSVRSFFSYLHLLLNIINYYFKQKITGNIFLAFSLWKIA